jgi:hypothetical protein
MYMCVYVCMCLVCIPQCISLFLSHMQKKKHSTPPQVRGTNLNSILWAFERHHHLAGLHVPHGHMTIQTGDRTQGTVKVEASGCNRLCVITCHTSEGRFT